MKSFVIMLLAASLLFVVGGCKDENNPGGPGGGGGTSTSYTGVMAGTGISGSITINIPTAKRQVAPSAAAGDTIDITATLIINGGPTINLNGYFVVETGEIYLEGSDYVFIGVLDGGSITGTFSFPGGNGIFNCEEGTAANVKTFCGQYADNDPGTESGSFNMTIDGPDITVIVFPDGSGEGGFVLFGSINAENEIAIYEPENPTVVIAWGLLNPETNTIAGEYAGEFGGTWGGSLCD